MDQWLLENMPADSVIGVDSFLISTQQAQALEKLWQPKHLVLKPITSNPVDEAWNQTGTRPPRSQRAVLVHPINFAGKPYEEKIDDVKNFLVKQKAHAILITALDEIAWALNIRGQDIDFNPVLMSYLVITTDKCYFFVDQGKVTPEVRSHLKEELVEILPYEAIEAFLRNIAEATKPILCDLSIVNWRLYLAMGSSAVPTTSPITLPKSLKNAVEIEGMRQSHIRDGVALTAFLCWLENKVRSCNSNEEMISEHQVTIEIENFRHKMPYHLYPSFETIAGYGPNGAIIHYKPKEESSLLGKDVLFLLDSGAQYLDGTTDVTR
jgi:Xaa-Pro aminopeptidase